MGENSHKPDPPLTQNQDNAISDDTGDGHRLPDKAGVIARTPVKKAPPEDAHDEATVEEFGERGMGVAAKE